MNAADTAASSNSRTFLLAGGGSGGHISPGLAIAECLVEQSPTARCVFVCSQRTIDAHMLTEAGADHVPLPALPPSKHPLRLLRFLRYFRASKRICRDLIDQGGIDHVVALGGFIAAPAVAAARSCGVPVTLINLDNPPGKANRWMSAKCDRIWTAIELSKSPDFAQRVVGLPIRKQALAHEDQAKARVELDLDPDRLTLFVTGASQGATSINRFVGALARTDASFFKDWQVYHIAGHGADDEMRRTYAKHGIDAVVAPFLDEIGLAWCAADVALSRAGANSVAEAAANCVPTLFLPYPYHRDMHQRNNAQYLVDIDGARIEKDHVGAELNVKHVGPALGSLMSNHTERDKMRMQLLANRPPNAAALIARLLADTQAR